MPAAWDLFPSGCYVATRSHSPSNTSIRNLQLIAFSTATSRFWVSAVSRGRQGKVSCPLHTVWQACCCTYDLLCRVQTHRESCRHLGRYRAVSYIQGPTVLLPACNHKAQTIRVSRQVHQQFCSLELHLLYALTQLHNLTA